MRSQQAHPGDAVGMAEDSIVGAIAAGLIIPVLQYVGLAFFDALPVAETTGAAL